MTENSEVNQTDFNRSRLAIVLLTVVISLLWCLTCAGKSWSDGTTAAFLGITNLTLLVGYALVRNDRGLSGLLTFGAIFGIVELLADALCVHFTGTLDYTPARSGMLWLSPWWMPIAWMVVATQIGYFGALLVERLGLRCGALLAGILGAVNIPFYEEMAYHAHWWQYQECWMLPGTHTPLYIVVAELFIGFCLAPLGWKAIRSASVRESAWWGFLGGLSTVVGGLIGFGLVEVLTGRWP